MARLIRQRLEERKIRMKRNFLLASAIILVAMCLSVQPAPADNSAEVMKAYKQLLQNNGAFYDIDDQKMYTLKEWQNSNRPLKSLSNFTVVDMDGDGTPEVVLKISLESNFLPENGVLVLHSEAEKVYGFTIPYAYYLAKDGTYNGSLEDGNVTYCKVSSIEKDKYTVKTLACVETDPINEDVKPLYYINESEVTEDRHHAFVQGLLEKMQKNRVFWHEFNDENIAWVLYDGEPLLMVASSLNLLGSVEIRYAGILNDYLDFFSQRDDQDAALDALFSKVAKAVNIEPDTSFPKAYRLRNSFEPLQYLSGGVYLGYALHDLNNDGIPELFILSNNYSIHAIFSLLDGKPVLLDAYWSRNRCEVDKDGTFYNSGSSGAADNSTASYSYVGGEDLRLIREIGTESFNHDTGKPFPEPRYYRIENGVKTIISEKEADVDPLWRGVSHNQNALNLNFFPLFSIPPTP